MVPMSILISMAAPPGGEGGPLGGLGAFVPIIAIFVIFYFLLIRPQQKRQKEHQKMIDDLKKGDDVITAGGIHGTVVGVAETIATVEIAKDIRVKVTKSSIGAVKTEESQKEKDKKK